MTLTVSTPGTCVSPSSVQSPPSTAKIRTASRDAFDRTKTVYALAAVRESTKALPLRANTAHLTKR
jgi:hypothetical protein